MTARRAGAWASPLVLLPLLWPTPRDAQAQGAKSDQPTASYRSEGRDPLTFNVQCTSSGWTQVLSSDTISRSTYFQATSSNTNSVCLIPVASGKTAPTSATACSSTTASIQLFPATTYTDYSRAAWWCAAATQTVTNTVLGVRNRDRNDFGAVGKNYGN